MNSKQIMTGPSGNRLSICHLRFRIESPRVPMTSAHYYTIMLLKEKNYFNWKLISSTMGLVTKNTSF